MTDEGMDEIVEEFIAECNEILNTVDEILVAAEAEGLTDEAVGALFRGIHTVKGTAAFLDFGHMSSVAHDAEHLLSRVRDKVIGMNKARTDLLLDAVDALRGMLSEVETSGTDGENDHAELVVLLTKAAEAGFGEDADESGGVDDSAEILIIDESNTPDEETLHTEVEVFKPEVTTNGTPESANTERATEANTSVKTAAEKKPDIEQVSIRVDTAVLDRLIDLVGELVLARNQLLAAGIDTGTAGQRLNHVVTELQEGIMRTRMQPVATLLAKAPRIARDAANQLQKRVRVAVDAGDTELDRGVLEAVRDPLTHLLRNAVDHGIERPAERNAAGKQPEGVIDIKAWHESGHVVVEVRDDGRGIDPDKVRAKAVEKGLVDPSKSVGMTTHEIHQLLLMPGFSTAETVTSVSGRGVGMDVVRSNVERIGGSIEVDSEVGVGTAWRLRIPLTLAILPVLVVRVGEYRLAIPSSALREALRVDVSQVEVVGDREVLRLRGELLPLVHVAEVLGEDRVVEDESLRVIVVSDGQSRVGLVVSEIGDPAEIVVKPLGTLLAGVGAVAGATVMGDGRIAYILDVAHVAEGTGEAQQYGRAAEGAEPSDILSTGADVIIGRRGDVRVAFDVTEVERLERFQRDAFEFANNKCVVQYRGGLLEVDGSTDSGYVVVCRTEDGTLYGVGIDEVEDVSDIQVDDGGAVVVGGSIAERYVSSIGSRSRW